nr:hypothetical protein [Tanacetum cinerariifolium]
DTVSYDQLYASLVQFEPYIQASKAKRAARNHNPLALIAHSNASSSQAHASPSYSNLPKPYYVTHPSSVVDYEEDYQGELQGDSQEDKLITAMMLLVQAITHKFFTPTDNHLRTSSNTRNQVVIQDGQMLLAMKDEVGSNLKDEENDFKLDNFYGDKTLEELNDAAVSEVNASHKMIPKGFHEHKNHGKCKTVVNTSNDDQIYSNIIFDDPYVENNVGPDEQDSNAHDEYYDVKIMAYNVERELKIKNN